MSLHEFDTLSRALRQPGVYRHRVNQVESIETHISLVLLAGEYAYKLKKPLELGFLDFSTLARREHFCHEELRLNRRLAAEIYLGVVPITGTPELPSVGGAGPAIEYAVKMRRFPQDALLNRQTVTADLVDAIAERVADFHEQIPIAASDSGYGAPPAVLGPMLDNFTHIRPRLGSGEQPRIDVLATWTRKQAAERIAELDRRREEGHIRECHGDMHRGNIAILDGEVVIFDAIEFAPTLRWIDTISEVAFLVMDLDESGYTGLARRFLNRYLQLGGDYGGLPLLTFYKVYRAMVRAKVIAIRLGQAHRSREEADADRLELARYLALAEGYTQTLTPMLILTHGVSGVGKSWLASVLTEHLEAVHIRSDVERKRLYGLRADADSAVSVGDIYTTAASARTYDRLLDLARTILQSGRHAIVDAAFLRRVQRRTFIELAERLGFRCCILRVRAPETVLRQRLEARRRERRDASEADARVLDRQLVDQEPLANEELDYAIEVDNARSIDVSKLCEQLGL